MILTTTGITSRAGTANLSGASEPTPGLDVVRIAWMLVFCEMFCGSLFAYLSCFRLIIVMAVLIWFTVSDWYLQTFFLNKIAINKSKGKYIVHLVGSKPITLYNNRSIWEVNCMILLLPFHDSHWLYTYTIHWL